MGIVVRQAHHDTHFNIFFTNQLMASELMNQPNLPLTSKR